MTANPSHVGALLYADEASFGEVSTTFDERLPIVNNVNAMAAGLVQGSENFARTKQYKSDGEHNARLSQSGSFDIELMLTGHGSTCAGAITASVLGTFLGRVIGNLSVGSDGGTVDAAPTDADTFSLTGATFATGALCRIGALNDGDGEGQFYALDDATSPSDPIVKNSLAGTPVQGAVVYAPELIYPSDGPTDASITTFRFQIQTANQRYNCFGCYPTAITISGWNPGELPRVTVTMAVSAWAPESASTFPTVTTTDAFQPHANGAGSIFFNDYGTTTRATIVPRDLSVNFNLVNVPLIGQGAARTHQSVVGVRRAMCNASVSVTLDREAAGTDGVGDWWNTAAPAYKHMLITNNPVDGYATGIYFPKLKRIENRPTQMDLNGLNAHTVQYEAITGGDLTSALTYAPFVLALA